MSNKSMTRRITVLLSAIILSYINCLSSPPVKTQEIELKINISEDATPAVLKAVLEAQENASTNIKFEKGTYHFYPDKGFQKYCFISNHCDLMVRTAFPLIDMQNVTIDGQGSTFVFHGIMIPFLIEGSENINIKNVSIDWYQTFHAEGKVIAHDVKNGTFDMEFPAEFPYEIRNGELLFIKEHYEHNTGQIIVYDPERHAIAYRSSDYTPKLEDRKPTKQYHIDDIKYKYEIDEADPIYRHVGRQSKIDFEEVRPGVIRFKNHKKELPPVGLIMSAKGAQGYNRVAPAFRITTTNRFMASNVTVHHAGGMGLIAENSSDLILESFNVIPSKGHMVSATADATHFVGCRGIVQLKNCTLRNQLDDGLNVHGTYQRVVDLIGECKIGVRMGHHQQKGFVIGNVNDSLGFIRLEESFFPFDMVTIKDIQVINERYQIITLNEKVPAELKVGDLIENLDAYPEVLVEGCHIEGNRARGLLISTPRKTVVRNNYFHTEMEAILVPVESGKWYESGSVTNLTIENNTFQDCNFGGKERGIIRFVTDDDNKNIAFKNIRIINNTINQFDNMILEVANTDGLLFEGNTITNSGTFPQLFGDNAAFYIKSSKNIEFKKNKYKGKATQMIHAEDEASKIKFK